MNRSLDKFIIAVLSLVCLVISAILIIVALDWTSPEYYLGIITGSDTNRWILGIVGAVLVVVFLVIFIRNLRKKPSKVAAIHENSLGLIKITLPALENLVLTAAQSVIGIREVKPVITSSGGGLAIHLKVQVSTDTVIPNVSEELQRTVRDYVGKMAGTTVKEIHVSVTKISWESKSRVE
ncbi:MAG: alkaline shock response membrane anchor protein AmaP [Peptococcia bacterium]